MFEIFASELCSARIAAYNNVPFLTKQLVPHVVLSAVRVKNSVASRSAIDSNQYRIFFIRIEVGRLHHPAIQIDIR